MISGLFSPKSSSAASTDTDRCGAWRTADPREADKEAWPLPSDEMVLARRGLYLASCTPRSNVGE